MNRKKKIIYVVLIVILILVYLGRQTINYIWFYNIEHYTDSNYEEWMKEFEIHDTINIKKNLLDEEEYLTFKNIKIRNDFKNYTKLEEISDNDSIKYVLYDENNKSIASFWIWKSNSYVDILKGDVTVFGSNDNILSTSDRVNFLEDNNITNDIDLIEYVSNNKNIKNNFFDSAKKMKENFTIQFFTMTILPNDASVTLIAGDYLGYILNIQNRIREVHILNNYEVVGFTFVNKDYYSDQYILDLLNTIVIE